MRKKKKTAIPRLLAIPQELVATPSAPVKRPTASTVRRPKRPALPVKTPIFPSGQVIISRPTMLWLPTLLRLLLLDTVPFFVPLLQLIARIKRVDCPVPPY